MNHMPKVTTVDFLESYLRDQGRSLNNGWARKAIRLKQRNLVAGWVRKTISIAVFVEIVFKLMLSMSLSDALKLRRKYLL